MKRVFHQVLTLKNMHRAPAEPGNIIDRSLQDSVVLSGNLATFASHRDRGTQGHFRMHPEGELAFLRWRRYAIRLSCKRRDRQDQEGENGDIGFHLCQLVNILATK